MPWLRLLPALSWAGLIFILSSMSSPPGAPGTEWASLMAHAAAFGVLAVLLVWFTDSARLRGLQSRPKRYAAVWFVTVLYGISDEVHQAFVPGRNPAIIDLAADGGGAAIALAFWALFSERYHRSRMPRVRATPAASREKR